jgi:hypothetical protein
MSPEEREKERERKNAIYSGHLRLCEQPRAAHAHTHSARTKSIYHPYFLADIFVKL